jgi:VWFA-related protein
LTPSGYGLYGSKDGNDERSGLMKSRASVAVAATLALGPTLALAETAVRPAPVIQVGVDLIRIDATVTDEDGRPVTDLRPEDFRLKVDGKLVPVQNAAFFGRTPADGATRESGPDRSIVFVIDDLVLSPEGVAWTRDALQAFAAARHAGNAMIGVRFTSDESDKVLLSRDPRRFDAAVRGFRYRTKNVRNGIVRHADFQQRMYSILTTLNALRSAPGRKAVILVSDGLWVDPGRSAREQFGIRSPFDSLFPDGNSDAAMRMIVEVANRASTVVHTVSPSGIEAPWPGGVSPAGGGTWFGTRTWAPSVANAGGAEEPLGPAVSDALDQMERRQGLRSAASETGGLAFFSRNGLERALQDIAEDQRSYYLIGFAPPKSTFARSWLKTKFRTIKLAVDRPGVRVRTRAGFYGVTDEDVLKQAPLSVSTTPAPLSMP